MNKEEQLDINLNEYADGHEADSHEADGHESQFKEIVGKKNLGLAMYCWNSLFFWVDIKTRLLKCYDMEHRVTTIFE